MYNDPDRLRADALSKSTGGGVEADQRHLHNIPGSWQDLAAQAAVHGLRFDVLPDDQAEALHLRVTGHSLRQIGDALGVSTRTVRKPRRRATGALQAA